MKSEGIKKVLLIGSGPIVIGQACEFDYSGTQACKALMGLGLEVILINSNPATIMTDPQLATRVYIEPLTLDFVSKVIEIERPDALIPTLGGQTALNLALELHDQGVLEKYQVRLLGADPKVIRLAEDREKFRDLLDSIGAKSPQSVMVRTYEEGLAIAEKMPLPLILRPNYTLGGSGGGIAYSLDEYSIMLASSLRESPTSEVLVEQSILGWYEYELEIMRDHLGSFVVICSIENFDPCGVHTGDSITIAPQQTLTDQEYQAMRDEAFMIADRVGISTGGANIQFAIHPHTRERVVIEMNPRVSRSSALASKATGFPIAKIAALLSVGQSLDQIRNDITRETPASYEPALDYVVTKIPKFNFEKFPGVPDQLTTQMKSVGEVMALGRSLPESLMKAISALEKDISQWALLEFDLHKLTYANSERIFYIFIAFRQGYSVQQVHEWTGIHPYFLEQIEKVVLMEKKLRSLPLSPELLREAKKLGLSDLWVSQLTQRTEAEILALREAHQIFPGFEQVDTCAGEFRSETPYYYSSYHSSASVSADLGCLDSGTASFGKMVGSDQKPIVAVIGSGANRIGQGVEFDYCCVQGVRAFQALGYPVAMINSNPETVSTDYDTADFLFFEPLTVEHVHEVFRFLKPSGFVAGLGGQTPISLARGLVNRGATIIGSSYRSIELAEDRALFNRLCQGLGFNLPKATVVHDRAGAEAFALQVGFPLMVRPSFVLGGRRMEICASLEELQSYFERHRFFITEESPCYLDQFLEGALELDVDLVVNTKLNQVELCGIVEHIEAAGVHSGDSFGVLPPQRLRPQVYRVLLEQTKKLALALEVQGFLNLQLAIKNDEIFVIEANPRASRTIPFVAKARGVQLVQSAVMAMLGMPLPSLQDLEKGLISVKGVVFPFKKFKEADSILGPEMKSTGESMGRGKTYGEALMKALLSAGVRFPDSGEVFLSLQESDKPKALGVIKQLASWGYKFSATAGTARFLEAQGFAVQTLLKVHEGRPNCVDRIRSGEIKLVINTTRGKKAIEASFTIRRACTDLNIPCVTETDMAEAFIEALKQHRRKELQVYPLMS